MVLTTGTKRDICSKAPTLSRSQHYCIAIREPRKGEYFLRPSGVKDTFHLEVAEQNFNKNMYLIINSIIGDFYKDIWQRSLAG